MDLQALSERQRQGKGLAFVRLWRRKSATSRNTWTRPGRCYVLLATAQRLAGECTVWTVLVTLQALPRLYAAI